MGKIVAVVNQKGGVGKTTTAVNLTAALTEAGKRILLCDFDPQANATSGLGVDKRKIRHSVYDVTINDVPAEQAIISTKYGDVIPTNKDLSGASVELVDMEDREYILKKTSETEQLEKDIAELTDEVKNNVTILPVAKAEEVLRVILEKDPFERV